MEKEGVGHLIKVTFCLVLGLSVVGIGFVFLPPSRLDSTTTAPREPASLVGVDEKTTLTQDKDNLTLETVELKCDSETEFIVPYIVHQVRLVGSTCTKQPAKVTVSNSTTGIQATVFAEVNAQFSTDLIQLKPGENIIEIENVDDPLRSTSALSTLKNASKSSLSSVRSIRFRRGEPPTSEVAL